jgi:putative transcriptional regulator
MAKKKIFNNIRVVLAEKEKTNIWLAEKIKRDPMTVSRYCTNTSQPDLKTLFLIADVLEVHVNELIATNDYIIKRKNKE